MNNELIMLRLNEVPTALEIWKNAIINWKDDPDEKNYIIYNGETPVGWIGINNLLSKEKTAFIKIVSVIPECHNKGIGQKAVSAIIEKLKQWQFVTLSLYTDKSNIQAQACYMKCGFKVVEEVEQKMSNGISVKRYKMSVNISSEN